MRRASVVALLLLATLLHGSAWAQRGAPDQVFTATVERVTDGDTVVFPQGVCRLLGIDAPEKAQPLGPEAGRTLSELLGDRPVLVLAWGKDKYGRMLCLVLAEDGYDVERGGGPAAGAPPLRPVARTQVRLGTGGFFDRQSHEALLVVIHRGQESSRRAPDALVARCWPY